MSGVVHIKEVGQKNCLLAATFFLSLSKLCLIEENFFLAGHGKIQKEIKMS